MVPIVAHLELASFAFKSHNKSMTYTHTQMKINTQNNTHQNIIHNESSKHVTQSQFKVMKKIAHKP
jgi:hypothetical protein